MSLREALDRTLLLMRDEVGQTVADDVLLDALRGTRVALVADAANIRTHSAQTAYVTAAMLMARSGHQVFLVVPEVTMAAPQPPLRPGLLADSLYIAGQDLLPGIEFVLGVPAEQVDLAIALGDSPVGVSARRCFRLNAEPWAGAIEAADRPRRWMEDWSPFGALAAAGLAAGEAFKISMRRLLPFAINPAATAAVFADTNYSAFRLAPPGSPVCNELGEIDWISGGAITNAALYALARIPGVTMRGRIIEPDTSALSNLNRYMLLLRSQLGAAKANDLSSLLMGGLALEPVVGRYGEASALDPLARTVSVGVDDIPSRWAAQRARPDLLVVGATTHWSAMASFHRDGLGCAQCLHPEDDTNDAPIPTMACVSFWAGLLAASYLAREAAGQKLDPQGQQVFLTPFRPESPYSAQVPAREGCPSCAPGSRRKMADAA